MNFRNNSSTQSNTQHDESRAQIVPKGILIHVSVDEVRPNPNNPRRLFDPGPLHELKESIKAHGVLVPITIYKLPGQDKYAIVDGERRYRCCVDLQEEGIDVPLPANVVESPDKMASLIYMFNIHAFREQWELMPTALSLQEVMKDLNIEDNTELHEITGLTNAQIERCKKILSFPEEFQRLSLESDPARRIPSNFWVELHPFLEISQEFIPDLYQDLGRNGITQIMVDKYRAKSIKSVIHFRRILEAIEVSENEEDRQAIADRIRDYVLTIGLETREAFDGFIRDTRKVQKAVGACDNFIRDIKKAKVDYTIEGKEEIILKLLDVIEFVQSLLDKLQSDEPPEEVEDQKDD
jgi:ParB family chromosome partitioning protein